MYGVEDAEVMVIAGLAVEVGVEPFPINTDILAASSAILKTINAPSI